MCMCVLGRATRSLSGLHMPPILLYHRRCRPLLLWHQEKWQPNRTARAKGPAPAELEARSEPGNGSAQRSLHLSESSSIRVALSGPEEAFEAILAMARHEVDMQVGDALTDVVIESDERPVGG